MFFNPFCVTTEKVTCVWFDMDCTVNRVLSKPFYLSTTAGIWRAQGCTQNGQNHINFNHVVSHKENWQMCLISKISTLYGPIKYVFVRHKILWVDIYFYICTLLQSSLSNNFRNWNFESHWDKDFTNPTVWMIRPDQVSIYLLGSSTYLLLIFNK